MPPSVPASQESSVQRDETLRTPSIDLDAPPDFGMDVEIISRTEKKDEALVAVKESIEMQFETAVEGLVKEEEHVELEDDVAHAVEVQIVEHAIISDEAGVATDLAGPPAGASPTLAPAGVVELEARPKASTPQPHEEATTEVAHVLDDPAPAISEENATFDAVKGQLVNLVGNLDLAKLTKDQVSEVEDMIMDVKEKLYGAARRGRKAGL